MKVIGFILITTLLSLSPIVDNASHKIIHSPRLEYVTTLDIKVVATVYRPSTKECDSTPLITATGARINPKDPLGHKWIAVSRDLLKLLNYGDTVVIKNAKPYDGRWVVQDCMNKRYTKRIDFLVGFDDPLGKWNNVQLRIIKIKK